MPFSSYDTIPTIGWTDFLKFQHPFNAHLISFRHSPAGWDNEKKVAILYENMHSVNPDHYYTDVIARPMIRKVNQEKETFGGRIIHSISLYCLSQVLG